MEHPLHHREAIPTADGRNPIDRYRVAGGWLYHAYSVELRNGANGALCFVPDVPPAHDAPPGHLKAETPRKGRPG